MLYVILQLYLIVFESEIIILKYYISKMLIFLLLKFFLPQLLLELLVVFSANNSYANDSNYYE